MSECKSEKSTCNCKKRHCRLLRGLAWLAGILVVLCVLGVTVAPMVMGPAIEKSIEVLGPKVLKVPVEIGSLKFSLMSGTLQINNFVLGNPEGYHTESMIQFEEVYVKMEPMSVFSKTIHVEQVQVRAPHITYEVGLGNSNVGTLLNGLKSMKGKKKEKAEKEDDSESSRKVTIDLVEVSGGQIRLSAKVLSGTAVPIPLPTVTLHDLGKNKASADVDGEEGISIADASVEILTSICTSVVDSAKKSWNVAGDAVKSAGDAVKNAGSAVKDAGSKMLNFFKKGND